MAEPLPSGLLEACVVVGLSNDTLKESLLQVNESPLLLDPEVLQVHAPPFVTKGRINEPGMGRFSHTQRRFSFIKKKNDRPLNNAGKVKEEAAEDFNVPKDLDLAALPQLCFPGGLSVSQEQQEEQFHFLVFTDVFGNQSHGVVLQYYRPVQKWIFQERMLNGHHPSSKSPQIYSAYGICIISKHPYYNTLKDCLSSLLCRLKICKNTDMEEEVKEFSAKLALVPIPPPGQLHVMFTLSPLTIVLPSREDKNYPVIDLDLHLPLLCFESRELLQIITSILTEQRMVFFSSDWAKLTLIAECFMLYIRPLRWQHPLVPTLSRQMLDFVMAPTPFLMGCHLSHYEEVAKETDDLILINIDEGTVCCSGNNDVDLPEAPQTAAQCFKSRRKVLQIHYDLEVLYRGICSDVNELRMRRRHWQHRLNRDIQNITLELIVNMFRDVDDHLNYEHRVFNTDEFLKTREPADQPFYKKVLETHIFHSFLKDHLNGKLKAFTRMERNTRTEDQKRKASMDFSHRRTIKEMKNDCQDSGLSKRLGTSLPNLGDETQPSSLKQTSPTSPTIPEITLNIPARPVKMFKLAHFPPPLSCYHVCLYFGDLVLLLNRAISATPPDDSSLLARYYYLRGLVNMLNSKRLDALSDFQTLYKTDIEIFPHELVRVLVDSLHVEEKAQAEKRSELRPLISKARTNDKSERIDSDDRVKKFQLPRTPMQLEEFVRCTQESGIVRDVATAQRLFEALTVGEQKQIDPETFRVLYTYWKESEAEAQDLQLPAEVLEHLDNSECVYKLSSSVKTSYGVGKIAMTQKRLFLLTTGRPGYVEITKFRDIEDLKISTASFLLLRIPSLKIKNRLKKEKFEANLKSECELWNLMVKEMWAGRIMADNHKDPQYVQQALTNVLLMDTVVGCLQTQKAVLAASKLAYYEKLRHEVPMIIPRPTAETLKHKINPSENMRSPQSVDVLLFIPGQLTLSADLDGNPKLWCALSCGKVVVFDAVSWTLQQHCIHVGESSLNCMMGLDQEQLWIGSQDSVIYIINTRSMLCHKQLTEHRGEVTDFALEKLNHNLSPVQVFSCSADGTVIVWDVPTLKVKRQFHLTCDRLQSIQIHDTLWCGASDCVMELRQNGCLLRKISLLDANIQASVFSRITLHLERKQIWTSFADSAELCIWDTSDLTKAPKQVTLPGCCRVTCMIKVKDQVWIGCNSGGTGLSKVVGKIFVLDSDSLMVEKELEAHEDCVQTLFSAEDRYVFSGSASLDGKIAIWRVD
ncbi:DENN domain-containing protein 3 isoform X2 [Paramisgurnus dabryanus]|uniref:DENN domain-containing protein 3 isoform X2 n=1 Tax=Paramisgurnus dabryanus TaxID=90735 RepID=UPI0031F3559D